VPWVYVYTHTAKESKQTEVQLATMQVSLAVTKTEIDPMWILCDSESTVDIYKNRSMLTDISKTKKPITIKGIDGNVVVVSEEGTLLGYGRVYYHPQVTANVLSFFNIAKQFKSVTYNNRERDALKVTRDDGSIIQFIPSKEGLYYHDFNNSIERSKSHSMMIVESVEQLKRNYNKREIEAAEKARRLYVMMGKLSEESFELMI
jgi:hypothetical protein